MNSLPAASCSDHSITAPSAVVEPSRIQSRFASLAAAAAAVLCFHLAQTLPGAGFLILGFLYGLLRIGCLSPWRRSFYLALGVGLAVYAPQLRFFASIFGPAALVLWLILAFYLGLFAVLVRAARLRLGAGWAAVLAPVLWTGLEYFRSELYYLRFSWLNTGFAFASTPGWIGLTRCGVYGAGFLLMAVAAFAWWLPARRGLPLLLAFGLVATGFAHSFPAAPAPAPASLRIAGVQLEVPADAEVITALDRLIRTHPDADLFILSEYTYQTPPPADLLAWCRRHQRHVVVGGREPIDDHRFYNMAFVIDPRGDIVFRQAKSVPIQFFQDGVPAPAQAPWLSPWGPLGIAVCYDLSYARVTDRLAVQGARALIVPTMDVAEWGENEFQLHTRVAPIRSAEYGIPIVRVSSSGISQVTGADGRALTVPVGRGQGATIAATIPIGPAARLPWDRSLAPAASAATALSALGLAVFHRRRPPSPTIKLP